MATNNFITRRREKSPWKVVLPSLLALCPSPNLHPDQRAWARAQQDVQPLLAQPGGWGSGCPPPGLQGNWFVARGLRVPSVPTSTAECILLPHHGSKGFFFPAGFSSRNVGRQWYFCKAGAHLGGKDEINLLFLKQPAVSEWELTDFSLSVKNYVCCLFYS